MIVRGGSALGAGSAGCSRSIRAWGAQICIRQRGKPAALVGGSGHGARRESAGYQFKSAAVAPEVRGVEGEQPALAVGQQCWRLVETKGQSKPNSGFVDIFGLKVFEVYQPRQAELQQKLEQERLDEDEDDWDDGIAAEMHRDILWVSIREVIPLIANWIAETGLAQK